ncbi:hypothetical protein SARU107417_01215 [Salinibacter ruber]
MNTSPVSFPSLWHAPRTKKTATNGRRKNLSLNIVKLKIQEICSVQRWENLVVRRTPHKQKKVNGWHAKAQEEDRDRKPRICRQ